MPAPTYHIAHLLPIKTIPQCPEGDGEEAPKFFKGLFQQPWMLPWQLRTKKLLNL